MQYLKLLKPFALLLLVASVFSACNNNSDKHNAQTPRPFSEVKKEHRDELINLNKNLVSIDYEVINKYIERHKWKMDTTETGLYYQIFNKTNGKKSQDNLEAIFEYRISKLDGTLIYSSEEEGLRKIILGHNQAESGLNEGLLLMKEGEKARFILPPHLAFGVPGDGYKIPYYTTLLYEINLLELKDNLNNK